MLARVRSASLQGIEAATVFVEVETSACRIVAGSGAVVPSGFERMVAGHKRVRL